MRRLIVFLVFLVFLFLVNVTFYFLSEDYEFFLKKLKNDDEIVYMDDIVIDDSIRNQLNDSNIAVVEMDSVNEIKEDEKETTTFISKKPEKIL
jgi:hypothetical protein